MDVQLDSDTARRLAELAEATHRPQNELAAQLLGAYLSDLQQWKADAIRLGLKEADAGQLTDIEMVRQFWDDKRAGSADSQR
jgi:predicted transcriptional regulator